MHNKVSVQHTSNSPQKQRPIAAVVGARGYSGLEVVRLLLNHPEVDLKFCFATEKFDLNKYFSNQKINSVQCFSQSEILKHKIDIVFLATPAEVSLTLAPQLLKNNSLVIDISGAFRLKKNSYSEWYKFEHTESELLKKSVYGLHPWVEATSFKKEESHTSGHLIANPGCYATAVTLGLAPLLKDDLITTQSIVVDAKSGTTGGGKKASENLLYSEVEGECLPYKVGHHQHYPEIQEALENITGKKVDFHFSTSLIPTRRGIIASIFGTLNQNVTEKQIEDCFQKYYGQYSMIKYGSFDKFPHYVSLKKVVGTNCNFISYKIEKTASGNSKIYLFSTIDNLLKGAAGQAVENMNRYFDYPVDFGLSQLEALQ